MQPRLAATRAWTGGNDGPTRAMPGSMSGAMRSTCAMRSADADARGTIISVITAIITEKNTCMM